MKDKKTNSGRKQRDYVLIVRRSDISPYGHEIGIWEALRENGRSLSYDEVEITIKGRPLV